jgi:hypothetical protein
LITILSNDLSSLQTHVTSTYTKLAHTFLSELEGILGPYIGGEILLNKATKEEQIRRLIAIAWNELFILHWSCLRLPVATSCLKYNRWKRGQKMIFVRILGCPLMVDFIPPTAPFVPARRPAPTLPLPHFPAQFANPSLPIPQLALNASLFLQFGQSALYLVTPATMLLLQPLRSRAAVPLGQEVSTVTLPQWAQMVK